MAKKAKQENTYFELPDNWEIINARRLKFGTFFSLKMDGLCLYNLRVVPEGDNWDAFIGMPESKGADGNYYKQYALYLTDEDTEEIIEAVEAALPKKKKASKKKATKKQDADEEDD